MPAVKRFLSAFCFSVLTASVAMSGTANADDSASDLGTQDLVKVDVITSEGRFTIQLRPDVAPETVANFMDYMRSGYYEGTVFHRVIPGFMIQGGGFTEQLQRKQTSPPIRNEATLSLPNLRGTLAMARTNAPDSATAQFFVNLIDNDFLNPNSRGAGYAVFGKVVSGMDVVDAIATLQTGPRQGMNDVPLQTIRIESMSIVDSSDQ
ncbi:MULTISPECIES: peptidylprolyl isomerase [unclassified Marinobacter]|jgi:peptidyl-prolyl cis-trans isomerase A (cyclophilin A)|uniref:peptidylprolyl isomerase n=1 Tax=unclassified Marinobacter TaxID=83889 RepID=UPI0020100C23|nr:MULTISPECIES: peptidylprolyl isomerase [unclassified Marinobacter]MCL1481934.1 peptidyl-prolyl cis-trans isomerase [Marinobacter sp.]MCL1484351.1 peptidyl-prolyl cis-trans isomerase [Marinobacter sp.]MCL1488127.1 peptidyl-prolyl cis-trans isomerase [Marinobacter sp.]UQG57878.1 peptidyl-prolyl cis-trans isomerase [Marinobacter sp. M4C]UQG66682.1 peptidyl-prolyl cis-trans isomerase [Marinobacter sp. M2C]